jgi:hypothetical protein
MRIIVFFLPHAVQRKNLGLQPQTGICALDHDFAYCYLYRQKTEVSFVKKYIYWYYK